MAKEIRHLADLMRTMQDDFKTVEDFEEIDQDDWSLDLMESDFMCDEMIYKRIENLFKENFDLTDAEFENIFSNEEYAEDFYNFENELELDFKLDVYQQFIVSERDAKQLNKYSEVVLYVPYYDVYVWNVFHFGMPYTHISVEKNIFA